jgi:hypothetical protein
MLERLCDRKGEGGGGGSGSVGRSEGPWTPEPTTLPSLGGEELQGLFSCRLEGFIKDFSLLSALMEHGSYDGG